MSDNPTLLPAKPKDPSISDVENLLEITNISIAEPNRFTNARKLLHYPGARGIFGGVAISQSLAAAQRTVPPNFDVHSLHCYFLLAGDSNLPIIYHVEHIRNGLSFASRIVHAKQHGRCIFTTTMSFVRENSGGKGVLQHARPQSDDLQRPIDVRMPNTRTLQSNLLICHQEIVSNGYKSEIHGKTVRHQIKSAGKISEAGGHKAHQVVLAFLSDTFFLGTVAAVHNVYKPFHRKTEGDASANDATKSKQASTDIGMMVSLDHTIYFHEPRKIRVDEWMFSEMSSPWSGQGRGLVMQHIYSADGTLIATCYQEGVLRLNSAKASNDSKL